MTMKITSRDARRLAISKQHLDQRKAGMRDVIRGLGCLQLDPISAVARSHLLVLWSRLGVYNPADFERLAYDERYLFEYWAHEASLVLTEDYPLHHWRMTRYPGGNAWGKRIRAWLDENRVAIDDLAGQILARFDADGPLPSRLLDDIEGEQGISTGWTGGKTLNKVLDYLWHSGQIMVSRREGNQRLWDRTENCLPPWTPRNPLGDRAVTEQAAQQAIRALGVATAPQIKQHFTRRRYPLLEQVLPDLVKAGVLQKVTILDGNGGSLRGTWYLHSDDLPLLEGIRAGAWAGRTTLLSPFDNLICDRQRTEQLFDFSYRMEIYVPKEKRQYGYYVLPLLHDDRLIGRIDPHFDGETLHVYNVYAEADAPADAKPAIRDAIESLAAFLGAQQINYGTVAGVWSGLG